jgi:hypothetical protein
MDLSDIKALKQELAKDLEAIERVEAMLKRSSNGASAPTTSSTSERVSDALAASSDRSPGVNTGLQELVVQIVAQNRGIRASEVKNKLMERGYKFRTPANAASSVFSALKRLVESGKVSKRGMKYSLIEQRELLHS